MSSIYDMDKDVIEIIIAHCFEKSTSPKDFLLHIDLNLSVKNQCIALGIDRNHYYYLKRKGSLDQKVLELAKPLVNERIAHTWVITKFGGNE